MEFRVMVIKKKRKNSTFIPESVIVVSFNFKIKATFEIQDHFIISFEKLRYGILTFIAIRYTNTENHTAKIVPHKRESRMSTCLSIQPTLER